MCIKSMFDSGFRGIISRQCKGAPIREPYVYSNNCSVHVYKHACVLKQPDGYMLVYTGKDMQSAFVDAVAWTDPAQTTLDEVL